MLVLDRKEQQGFTIGPDIEIKIISINRRRVKIGIHAPKELLVLREELNGEKSSD